MAIATPVDVAERLGRDLDESETVIVAARLDDVEELIFQRIPDLAQKILDGKIRQRLVVMVECEAVMRLIRNPEGFSQETDGNYSYTIDATVASGRLTILREEWAMLGIRSGVAMLNIGINMPTRLPWYQHWDPEHNTNQNTAVWG